MRLDFCLMGLTCMELEAGGVLFPAWLPEALLLLRLLTLSDGTSGCQAPDPAAAAGLVVGNRVVTRWPLPSN